MKKSKKILITLIIITILLIAGLLAYKYLNNDKQEVKIIKKIPGYGYQLKENATSLYKDEFENLDKILSKSNVNYEDYAKQIAKLFIIDFYTLDNKLSKNDIGGIEFIMDDMKDNFIEQSRSTFYKYLEVKSKKRKQDLPKVSEINDVKLENTTFTITNEYSETTTTTVKSRTRTTTAKGREVDAYKITISWDYKENLGYEKEAKMIIVKEGKKLYIVEMD